MSLTKPISLTLLVVLSAFAVEAQDMVGPSGPAESPPPTGAAPETPETPAGEAPGEPGERGVIGEGDVTLQVGQGAANGPEDESSGEATTATAPESAPREDVQTFGDREWTEDDARYYARWKEQFDDADYDAAAATARSWVSFVERSRDREELDLFTPLVKLGQALEWAEDPIGAAVAFRRAVDIGENEFGVFDMRLAGTLNALGRALYTSGRAEDAVPILMRAKDITHRNRGIYNLEQENIVRTLAEAFLATGEALQANREQRFIFGANEKAYGEESVDLVPALQRWARWNVRIGRDAEARQHFRRALEILEDEYGPNDLRLVETLEMVANSYYKDAVNRWPREGARSLQRVVDIYSAQEFVDQADVLRAQTRLGDWLMLAERPTEAVEAYREAIESAREAGVDPAAIRAVYGYPRPLHGNGRPLNKPIGHRFDDGKPRYILLEFNIDTRGRARNIRVVENTVGLVSVVVDVRERVHSTSFRPRFDDQGQPVATTGVRYRFELDTGGTSATPQFEQGGEPEPEPGPTQAEAEAANGEAPVEAAASAEPATTSTED